MTDVRGAEKGRALGHAAGDDRHSGLRETASPSDGVSPRRGAGAEAGADSSSSDSPGDVTRLLDLRAGDPPRPCPSVAGPSRPLAGGGSVPKVAGDTPRPSQASQGPAASSTSGVWLGPFSASDVALLAARVQETAARQQDWAARHLAQSTAWYNDALFWHRRHGLAGWRYGSRGRQVLGPRVAGGNPWLEEVDRASASVAHWRGRLRDAEEAVLAAAEAGALAARERERLGGAPARARRQSRSRTPPAARAWRYSSRDTRATAAEVAILLN